MLPPSLNESVHQERSGVLQLKPYERCVWGVGGGLLVAMASMFNSFTALAFVEGLRVE